MSLFGKVRVLVGALMHRPFLATPQKANLEEGQVPGPEERRQASSLTEASTADLPDQERVADLIARQQREAG